MTLQNRVLPDGEIVALPVRGSLTGNRGIIHRDDRTLGTSRWSHHAWISCTLDWQGRKRDVMTGRKWTELFFLDEAVALAAGHRPCGYCRRAAYRQFVSAWSEAEGSRPKAHDMDRILHPARVHPRTRKQITYLADIDALPSGTFIQWHDQPCLVLADSLLPYTPAAYQNPIERPMGERVLVHTPKPVVTVLQAGYSPILHPSVTA